MVRHYVTFRMNQLYLRIPQSPAFFTEEEATSVRGMLIRGGFAEEHVNVIRETTEVLT